MDAYRAVVDKRDPGLYVDPARSAPPPSAARRRLPLAELVHEDEW